MDKLLIIEDDTSISNMVKEYMESEGYEVEQAYDGLEALNKLTPPSYSLVLLDLMIPKLSGMQVMKNLREVCQVPIIIMSAKDSDSDKAMGLGLGADDYITKPFSMVELAARVKANIRRATKYSVQEQKKDPLITYKELQLNPDAYGVVKHGAEIRLTNKEFEILKLLISNPNRVFTKAQIYTAVWQEEYLQDENIINVHMRRLREKIEEDPSNPQYIKTLWGIGYKVGE